jgi:hypothetical protein
MKRTTRQTGAALIMSLLVMSLIGVLVAASLTLSSLDRRISSNDAVSVQAHAVAQAGAAFWKSDLTDTFMFMHRNAQRYQDLTVAAPEKITCGNLLGLGLDLFRNYPQTSLVPSGSRLTPTFELVVDGVKGHADVAFEVQGSTVILHAVGHFAGARATVVEAFDITTLDLWNHALLVERVHTPTVLHGRSDIRGGVHLLATQLGPNDLALNLAAEVLLGNTYRDLDVALAQALPGLRLSVPDPQDLCASLRVRSGHTQLGGSAALGQTSPARAGHLHGIHTNHGVRGGTEGGNVHSVNGLASPYDLGNTVAFPTLDSLDPHGTTWRDALEQEALVLSGIPFNADLSSDPSNSQADDRTRLPLVSTSGGVATVISNPAGVPLDKPGLYYLGADCDGPLFGVMPDGTAAGGTQPAPAFRLEHDQTESFACRKYRMTGHAPNPQRDEVMVEVIWGRTASVRQISSQVASSGVTSAMFAANDLYLGGTSGVVMLLGKDLIITGGNAPGVAITYRGSGVLFTERSDRSNHGSGGTVYLEVDVLPAESQALRVRPTGHVDATAGVANTFPATALLQFVARDSIVMHRAQKRYAAAMYAQESVRVTQQTLLAGGIVTKALHAAQVPSILQVPNLGSHLSPRIPGAGSTRVVVSRASTVRR